MYKTILVPVDLGHDEVATRILGVAAQLADKGGRVHVVHIMPEIPPYVDTYIPADIRELKTRDQHERLTRMAAEAGLPDAHIRVETGHAHRNILELIDELSPDLVIIGSHRPDISDYFLGSTAARVVRHAPCSVLVDRSAV